MTRIRTLYIGRGSFTVQLDCGHVQHIDGWRSIPRPGSSYDCPDCRAEQFTPVELEHLKFYRWARLGGWAFAMEEVVS